MIFINVVLTVKDPKDVAEIQSLLSEQGRLSRQEPGCVRFEVYHSQTDDRVFLLNEHWSDQAAIDAEISRQAGEWAAAFDAHSMLVLGRALNSYDVSDRLGRIAAKVLYVLSRTDVLFPPALAASVMPALAAAGVDARYFEIDTAHGHMGSGEDAAKWAGVLQGFLEGL